MSDTPLQVAIAGLGRWAAAIRGAARRSDNIDVAA